MANLDELRSVANLGVCQALDRWPAYRGEHGWDPGDHSYLVAFIQRRVNGALIDWARGVDHLTRTQRQTVKTLTAAQDEGYNGSAVAVAAGRLGVTDDAVRAAAAVQKPTSLDVTNADGESFDFPDPEAVEDVVATNSILGAAMAAINGLTGPQRLILVLRHYYALDLDAAAGVLGIDPLKAAELHRGGILSVHNSMLRAALA